MRLIAGLAAAALAGLAVGADHHDADADADVYIFPSSRQSSPETPRIPKEVARHILLQRAARLRYGSDLRDIPDSIDTETAVGHIARFGKSQAPLFTAEDEASQLVVILEGGNTEKSSRLREKLGRYAAFTIADPPSAAANSRLMALFRNLGVEPPQQCDLSVMINPFASECWTGPSSVVKYDLRTSPKTLDILLDNLSRLENFVNEGDLEVTLILLPESSRSSNINHWSAAAESASDLRRRADTETVISDQGLAAGAGGGISTANTNPAAGKTAGGHPARRTKAIPQCFATLTSCMAQTANCSGHGECANKYGANSTASCFACACKASAVERAAGARPKGRKTVHWGGAMCQKEDVSMPFWLIAGFTVAIVGAVAFAIGLLFNVGEEPLPGVIGAGVSRSK